MSQQIVAVIGASGFVGSAICNVIRQSSAHRLIEIRRDDDLEKLIQPAQIVIHAANPAKRFWAEKNPELDFAESVEKTANIKGLCGQRKLILISSISARTQLHNVYGRHRRACELIVEGDASLIVRLGPMYGENKNIGALADIMANRPVYVSGETKYAYVPVEYNAMKIFNSLNKTGIVELGAKNSIQLNELKRLLSSSSVFSGADDTQEPLSPSSDAPDAFAVLDFCKKLEKDLSQGASR